MPNNTPDKACVFCKRITNGEYIDKYANHVIFEPLNPVTPGHMLVVPIVHTPNLNGGQLEAEQTGWALRYFTNDLTEDYNIITSKGKDATQTIQHLHFHIVPRRADDGLALPWTGQLPKEPLASRELPQGTPDTSIEDLISERIEFNIKANVGEDGQIVVDYAKLRDDLVKALKAREDRLIKQALIDEINELVIASGLYPVDRAYSHNPFYCVDKPEVDERLAHLRKDRT